MASENNLRAVRVKAGYTAADLERASGVSDTTIRKIETRKIKGKVETKHRILIGLSTLTGKEHDYREIFPNG